MVILILERDKDAGDLDACTVGRGANGRGVGGVELHELPVRSRGRRADLGLYHIDPLRALWALRSVR